jgi:heptosyltransferase-3
LELPALFNRNSPKKILVIITRRIGDVLLTTPLIHTLKAAWPQAKIDVLVFKNTRGILSNHPDINQVIFAPDSKSKLANLKWIMGLWNQYDLAISALTSDRATFSAWIAGKYRIGLVENKPKQRWKKYLLNDSVTFDNLTTHTVSMVLKLASKLGLPLKHQVSVNWTQKDSTYVDTLFSEFAINHNQAFAVLHIYPKFSYKMWHSDGWLAVVTWLNEQNIQVILTGSSDQDEMRYIQQLLINLPTKTPNFAGRLNFSQMAYLLKKACVYVGPDTVATHLAAAMGTPTIALFGPSNPVKWGPWPMNYNETDSPWGMIGASQQVANVLLLQGLGDCVPCHQEGCDRHTNSRSKCLDNLPASRVIEAMKTLLT